jgi:cyclic beta-1,2-glucan synthetase
VADSSLTRIPTLRELAGLRHEGASAVSDLAPSERAPAGAGGAGDARAAPTRAARMEQIAAGRAARANSPTWTSASCTTQRTDLLAIGYNVSASAALTTACYDLLASEARLAVSSASRQGQFPQEHWFALGRQLCIVGGEQLLLSWSGSMFEYLMPLLVMPTYREHPARPDLPFGIVNAQIDYARRRDIPWGVSESGYNTVDTSDELPVPRLRRARHRPEARPGDDWWSRRMPP